MIPDSHQSMLRSTALASVATVGKDGAAQSSPVWFDWDGATLRFSTIKSRRKYRNMQHEPRVSILIVDPEDPYRYLEFRGRVRIEDDPEKKLINALSLRYANRPFPDRPHEERVVVSITAENVVVYP